MHVLVPNLQLRQILELTSGMRLGSTMPQDRTTPSRTWNQEPSDSLVLRHHEWSTHFDTVVAGDLVARLLLRLWLKSLILFRAQSCTSKNGVVGKRMPESMRNE